MHHGVAMTDPISCGYSWGALRHCWFIYWFKKGCVMDNANLFQLGIGLATGTQAEDFKRDDCKELEGRSAEATHYQ